VYVYFDFSADRQYRVPQSGRSIIDNRWATRPQFPLGFGCDAVAMNGGYTRRGRCESTVGSGKAPNMDDDGNGRPLERRVFREEIREQLIEQILDGRLPSGARIVETRIAQQFGVSQAPVREALRDLELFRFVVSSPFRGTQVRNITTEELLDIYPIRAALEGVAARVAATRIDEATLAKLERLIGQMREAAERNDHRAEASADHSFHHVIVKASGSRMLEHVWQTMRLSITTCVTTALTHRSLTDIAERHVAVVEALRSRDPDRAEAEIRRHIEEPGEWIRSANQQQPESQTTSAKGAVK
jgi:DNA-binding GntR family transcriptional regulator